jgi:H+/Cl- antiporter ClcA
MTGGASAGFSIATAAPVSAILFAVEELHKIFSPLLLTGVSLSVMTAQLTAQILSCFGIGAGGLFHLPEIVSLPVTLLFVPVLIGLVCGLSSVLFTRLYHAVERLVHSVLERVPIKILFPILFASVSIVGLALADTLGTGHALVDKLFYSHIAWYVLALVFLLRAVFMMVSNTAGVTGGVFLPTLAFGGMIGALCADGMTALGILEPQYRLLIVILGITAFLGATSRIPLTACVFALEALGGIHNILALVIATTIAYLGAELSGVEDFTDSVIEAKKRRIRKSTAPSVLVAALTVQENSFAVGKELRDILWPDACVVVSVERGHQDHDITALRAGDVLTLRYKTYDPEATAEELSDLVGEQTVNANA